MKKIKIITFQNAYNYGALLQAFALQTKLAERNEVEVINYENEIIGKQYKLINICTKDLKKLIKSVLKLILFLIPNIRKFRKFKKFQNKRINLTKEEYYNEEELKRKIPEADVYITGSDQVWNSQITKGLQDSYTLNFGTNDIRRISYAASIGNSQIDDSEKKIYKDKISLIDYISVREETGKNVLREFIDKPITVVLDPTLLLTQNDWENNIKDIKKEKDKYILAYMVEPDQEYVNIANELSDRTGLKIMHFSLRKNGLKNVLKTAYTKDPLEFVSLIKNAEYVICTSFHATVFSIIFNKKFFVVPHKKTGARVTDLLKKLGISDRAVTSLNEFLKIDYKQEINYNSVNKIIEDERQKSLNWLENAINS